MFVLGRIGAVGNEAWMCRLGTSGDDGSFRP